MTQKIDPSSKASDTNGIFGLPFKENEAKIVYLPIPWDVTTSYQAGTMNGPQAILQASPQIDFFDFDFINAYQKGLFMRRPSPAIKKMAITGRKLALKIIDSSEAVIQKSKALQKTLSDVNKLSENLNEYVYQETKKLLQKNKIPVIVGGDHSTPFGAIKAYSEVYPQMGILHFDAHSDTRKAYMGFTHSHASIMYNVMEKIPAIKKLVQVGIRDFCLDEYEYTRQNKKINVFFDQQIKEKKITGTPFSSIAKEIIKTLPKEVYISFDIDGLDPRFCPHTGTPVPGGLEYNEVLFLIKEIIKSKRKIIGFDLVEVAPNPQNKNDEWDANVGMRLLYKLSGAVLENAN